MRHPFLDAYIPLVGDGAAEDVAGAVAAYSPLVVETVEGITTRSLADTKHVVLISGTSIRFYHQKPGWTEPEDPVGLTVIYDTDDLPFVLVSRGDRYDLKFNAGGIISDGEEILASVEVTGFTIPAGFTGSKARCRGAATAEAIFLVQKNGVTFGTITFAIGSLIGVFASAADAVFAADDELSVIGPDPRDLSLSHVFGTIVAMRAAA